MAMMIELATFLHMKHLRVYGVGIYSSTGQLIWIRGQYDVQYVLGNDGSRWKVGAYENLKAFENLLW